MQTTYRRFPDYNSRVTVEATEDKVILSNKNMFYDIVTEYNYKELNGRIARGKVSDTGWSSIGLIFFFIPMFINLFVLGLLFPDYRRAPLALVFYGGFYLCAFVSFAMLARKENWVYFHKKDDSVAFAIKITSANQEQANAIVEHIKKQIDMNEEAKP